MLQPHIFLIIYLFAWICFYKFSFTSFLDQTFFFGADGEVVKKDRTYRNQDIIKTTREHGDQDKTKTFGVWEQDKAKIVCIKEKQQSRNTYKCIFLNQAFF